MPDEFMSSRAILLESSRTWSTLDVVADAISVASTTETRI